MKLSLGDTLKAKICRVGHFCAAFLAGTLPFAISAHAGPLVTLTTPTDFFTNVATRLLRAELKMDLNQIQVYPTNQYTPAVHRLLQVAANLYDCTTNRIFGSATNYPYCPSVFRPLFRRIGDTTNGLVIIAGFREVMGIDIVDATQAPPMIEVDPPNASLSAIPPAGMPFSSLDKLEPMVSGIPLIIGARKGFPNFNEFAAQTQVYVSRLLEFRRTNGTPFGPVAQTNQMYVIGISNNFGVEAWNSYVANYPRELSLIAALRMTAILTNETGAANVVFSNWVDLGTTMSLPTNSWSGWTFLSGVPYSMVLPFGTTNGFVFTNATALDHAPWLEPLTHTFPDATQGPFYVPQWWLNLKFRLMFALVDTAANRIVDYVNLSRWEPTVDITGSLAVGSNATNPADYTNPANEWITNRLAGSLAPDTPTYGIINQIQAGLSGVSAFQAFTQDPYSGLDLESAIDGFRYNLMGWSPLYPKDLGKVFYRSNVFYAPLDPYRPVYVHTSWQVNDPLVHYMANDLLDLEQVASNRVDFGSHIPPLDNLGRINVRYQPWGGSPFSQHASTDYQIAVRDPLITRSDDWDFPTNQALGLDWAGRIHRGTPWQTVFLKSTNILQALPSLSLSILPWEFWTGNDYLRPDESSPGSTVPDALFTAPTNDWSLVSLLNTLFNPNDPHQLASPNQTGIGSWEALLDGMTVLTNVSQTEMDSLVISSNSPQAALVAQAILDARVSAPGQLFQNIGDILAVPQLSVASPWLNTGTYATDEALEVIPSQLLPLLRPDSIGSGSRPGSVQFSGMDGYAYAIQVSSNLLDWTTLSTNRPLDGIMNFAVPSGDTRQFYRSKLVP